MSSMGGGVGGPAPSLSRRAMTNLSLGAFVATVPLEYRDRCRSRRPPPAAQRLEARNETPRHDHAERRDFGHFLLMHEDVRPPEGDLRARAEDQRERRADRELALDAATSAPGSRCAPRTASASSGDRWDSDS